MTSKHTATLSFVVKNPGCTQKDVIMHVFSEVRSRNYGRQRNASAAIASLRRKGLLLDDCERCPTCGRASRGRRDVPLYATKQGFDVIVNRKKVAA